MNIFSIRMTNSKKNLKNSNKKHFAGFNQSQIEATGGLHGQTKNKIFTRQKVHALQQYITRNLYTSDIQGTKSGSLLSEAVKNNIKAKKLRLQQLRQEYNNANTNNHMIKQKIQKSQQLIPNDIHYQRKMNLQLQDKGLIKSYNQQIDGYKTPYNYLKKKALVKQNFHINQNKLFQKNYLNLNDPYQRKMNLQLQDKGLIKSYNQQIDGYKTPYNYLKKKSLMKLMKQNFHFNQNKVFQKNYLNLNEPLQYQEYNNQNNINELDYENERNNKIYYSNPRLKNKFRQEYNNQNNIDELDYENERNKKIYQSRLKNKFQQRQQLITNIPNNQLIHQNKLLIEPKIQFFQKKQNNKEKSFVDKRKFNPTFLSYNSPFNFAANQIINYK